mmetsp:Transcript_66676/g.168130  ORF Transcript_66676/g.168130 Transcript_66676/m.168130 type:complete len:527 (-) Transcript_66676:78-1658(-)
MLWQYLEEDGQCWREEAEITGREGIYLIDNSILASKSRGLRYRFSPNVKDVDHGETARFGTLICGVRHGEDWLKVHDRYLPMRVQGVPVLIFQSEPEKEVLARCSGFEKWVAVGRARPAPRAPPPEWTAAVSKPEVLDEPFFDPGTGLIYEAVANRVAIRAAPSVDAAIQGCVRKGEEVELFEWDETRRWRQVQCPASDQYKREQPSAWTLGWVLLDHQEHGPLLRPRGLPYQEQPLLPLHVAVHEDNLVDLQLILLDGAVVDAREPDGRTALMVAAEKERLDCCVLLVQARADPMAMSPEGGSVLDYATEDRTKALLQALDYRMSEPDLEPLGRAARALAIETREVARKLIEQVNQDKKVRDRQRQMEEERAERDRRAKEEHESRIAAEKKAREEAAEQRARQKELRRRAQEQELARLQKQAEESRLREERAAAEEQERIKKEKVEKGELCEVIADNGVPVYEQPDLNSQLVGREIWGQVVELHEYDRSGKWRRSKGHDFDGTLSGWMPLFDENGSPAVQVCEEG